MVIVDSDVWSEAFRRKETEWGLEVRVLQTLIEENEILVIGMIRQEVLSGLRDKKRYNTIREKLRFFPDKHIETHIHELAATFFNICRSKGLQGSHSDFLICACSVEWKATILTKDKDFLGYSRFLPIELYTVGGPHA